MPELPEVEVTRRSFADAIAGATILQLRRGKPLRWPLGCDAGILTGRQVLSIGRRGKYLLIQLDQGCLLLHLGMSGSLRFAPSLDPPGVHDHIDLHTTQGVLRLHDPRRFGALVYANDLNDPVARRLLDRLGVEPMSPDFTPDMFCKGLSKRHAAIKQVLLAGDLVVGVGNIYASEALFQAGIRPSARADSLSRARARRLHAAIVQVLQRALDIGGSSLRDFSSATGQTGHFQLETAVYGRQGQACRVCASPVRMIRQGQRSSFFCPSCQPR